MGRVQEMRDAAVAVNPDVIVLCHGGPIAEPDDAAYVLAHTDGSRRVLRRLVGRAPPDRTRHQGPDRGVQGDLRSTERTPTADRPKDDDEPADPHGHARPERRPHPGLRLGHASSGWSRPTSTTASASPSARSSSTPARATTRTCTRARRRSSTSSPARACRPSATAPRRSPSVRATRSTSPRTPCTPPTTPPGGPCASSSSTRPAAPRRAWTRLPDARILEPGVASSWSQST